MNRPYVICHMLTSVNGKIDGEFMSVPECGEALAEYGDLRKEFDCSATLYGTTTMLGGFSKGLAEKIRAAKTKFPAWIFKLRTILKTILFRLTQKAFSAFLRDI